MLIFKFIIVFLWILIVDIAWLKWSIKRCTILKANNSKNDACTFKPKFEFPKKYFQNETSNQINIYYSWTEHSTDYVSRKAMERYDESLYWLKDMIYTYHSMHEFHRTL